MDIATLGFAVDAAPLTRATDALGKFSTQARGAGDAADQMGVGLGGLSTKATQAASSYEQLRSSLDPVYAASKRYEAALETSNSALQQNIISAQEHARVMQLAQTRYLGLTPAVEKLAPAVTGVNTSLARFTPAITNASFQIQDFAVQVASGQSAVTAFAQQFPQLAGVMGFSGALALVGAGLGTLVAVGMAVAPMFMQMADSTQALEDAVDQLQGAMSAYQAAMDGVSMASDELYGKFGSNAEAARELYEVMLDLAELEFAQAMSASVAAATAQFADLSGELDRINQLSEATIGDSTRLSSAFGMLQNAMGDLTERYGMGYGQLVDLNRAMKELEQAEGPRAQAQAAAALVSELRDAQAAGAEIPPVLMQTANELARASMMGLELTGNTENAAGALRNAEAAARGLAAALSAAAGFSAGIENQIQIIETRISAQRAGADAAIAGTIKAMQLDAMAARDRQIAAGVDQFNAEALYQLDMDRIDQLGQLTAEEKALSETAKASASAGAKASKAASKVAQDRLADLQEELSAREALIGVSGEERTRMEALQQVYSKLGDTAGQYSEAAIQGAADRIVAVDRETAKWEEHMGRVDGLVDDLASSWGDWLAGGLKDFGDFAQSILDGFKNMISSMIATAAKNRIMISMGMSGVPGMGAAGVPGMGGLGSIGSSIAGFGSSIAAGFGSVLSGFGAGGISGGFGAITAGLSGATSGLAGLGVALGAVALPIAALAAVFSFFKKSTKELDAGLRITVDGMDAMVETFSKTETRRFWGLSKKRKTSYDDASDEVSDPIENYVAEMQSAVLEAAASLGVGASAFEDFAAQISFSTKGLSEEQAIAKIQEEMGKIGDAFAEMIPGLQQFALEGEGALATLNRLTTNLTVVNGALADLGLNLYQASVAGAGAATAFADLFGGLEAFQQASSAYYQAFYTDGERLARLQEISTKAVRDAGLAVPATREAYRQLIEAQDLSTEAGREAAALLIQMAPAFDQLYTAADAARASVLELANAQRQLITDSGDLRRQMIRDSLTEEQRAAQDLARMNRVFEDMGVTVPQTAAEYRELLRGLDLTTEAGREALASLNGVGEILLDTFADALSAAEAAQQSVADARASREALLNDLMTEEQRAAQSQAQIMAVFESLNMAVPQTIEGLQALVQGLDLTTEAGRIALAAISEIAADLRDQLAASRQPTEARQREERIDAGRTAYASRVASQTRDLEKQIADLTMSDAQKRQQEIREREHLLRTMTPLNASLQQMVWRLEDAKQAVDELDTDKFSTLVDYERARARSANVNNAPGGTPAAEKKATEDRQKNDSLVLAEMRDYLLAVTNNTHRAARETRDLRVLQEIQTVQTGTAG